MPSIDMPLEQMRQYKPTLYRAPDFEDFWDKTVTEAVDQAINAELIPFDLPARGLQCYAVRFDGYKGGRLAGWYVRPTSRGKFPGVCTYHSYGSRGTRPLELIALASQGICVLSMDCRGQSGQSQDAAICSEGSTAGWLTRGIREPSQAYLRYVYADAIRALELLARREEVDETRVAVMGESQGGGISIAVAALSERPVLALADIPFLSDFRRAIEIASDGPYREIVEFLKAFPPLYHDAITTLGYFDAMNLSPWIKCRTIVCNCLWDDVCPPSTVFAAYNHMLCEKQIEIYPFHKHEVPYEHHETRFRALIDALGA